MKGLVGLALILGIVLAVAAACYPAAPKQLEGLAFLIGEWAGGGGGNPGEAAGSASFTRGLQDRVIVRTSYAEYPATESAPASRHDDLMIIYAAEGEGIRADYFDNEGHVIRYAVTLPAPEQAVFTSDPSAEGPRFRLSYTLGKNGVLKGEFDIATPDKPDVFAPYLTWESSKISRPAKAEN